MSERLIADLVDRNYAELFAYLYRLLYDRERAAALAQETFLRAYEARDRLARLRGERQRLWLFRAASQLAGPGRVSRFGRRGANLEFAPEGGRTPRPRSAEGGPGSPLPVLAWGVPGPVERALAGLADLDRALVLLVERYGFGTLEAAQILGIGGRAARQRLAAAHEAFDRAGLARLPEPWPDRHLPLMLAADMRRGDVSGYGRMTLSRPAPVPPRLVRIVVALLVIAIAAGLWSSWHGGPGRLGSGTPPPTPVPPAAVTATPELPTPAPLPRADQPGPGAVAWLTSNAMPLESVEPGSKPADLAPLLAMVGDVRVVALDDDADFGSHETQAFRERLLEMLVEEKGFNTLVLQVDWAAGELLDRYIQGADADPIQVLDQVRQSRGLAGGIWQTQEMLYTLRWLRAHNEKLPEDERVTIHGFLPIDRPSNVPRAVVVDYLRRIDPAAVERAYGDHRELLASLRDHRDQYVTRSRYADYRHAVSAAQVLAQYDRLAAAPASERGNLYDSAALENLIAIAERAGTDGKGIVWTASLASAGLPAVENVIQSFRRQEGGAVSLTFAFGQGPLYLVGKSEPEPPGVSYSIQNQYGRPARQRLAEYVLPPAEQDTYEDYFGQAGKPRFFVDLRRAFRAGPATDWLRGPHYARSVGPEYWDCFPEDYYRQTRLSMSYDLVVYFDRVTPATLLSRPAVLPDARCPRAPIPIDLREGVRGWTTEGDPGAFAFGVGAAPASAGTLAAFIGSEQTGSRGALTQSFRADDYRGHRVRLSVRTLVQGNDVRADLWLAMTGLGGETITSVTKPVLRAGGWHANSILVDVPARASRITYGVKLRAPGWVWLTDQGFEIASTQ